MYNSIFKKGLQCTALFACLLGAAACQQAPQEDKEVQVELQLSLREPGGGTGTGGSSRDTTITTSGKVTGGVLKLQVSIPIPPPKGSYQLGTARDLDIKATGVVRYVKLKSDTGGSNPDTLYYKAPRDGKDDDDRK